MKLNLVLELTKKIKVYANQLNWVLDYGNKNERFYYTTLDELFDDLFEIKLVKRLSINNEVVVDVSTLSDEIKSTRSLIRKDLERFQKLMTKADRARRKGVFSK
jgi:hypothetical protein